MIDASKCEYEESYHEPDCQCDVHYFTYPKDLKECNFCQEKEYGNVLCMCISLSVYENGEYDMAMSPTVEEGDSLMDVDWKDLDMGINYTEETISNLLNKVKEVGGLTTPEMIRCKHCSYLVEDNDGNWICDDCGKEIHEIPNDECSAEQEW